MTLLNASVVAILVAVGAVALIVWRAVGSRRRGPRHMFERCAGWYERFAPNARLELADESIDAVRDPRMKVRQGDSLALLRIGDQVD